MQTGKRNDNLFWTGLGTVMIIVVLALAVTPAVFAQSRTQSERLLNLFEDVFQFVEDNYVDEVDPNILIEGALRGLFESLDDPHSAYLDEDELRGLTDTTSGEFGGVGMYISKDSAGEDATDFILVQSPIEDTPAFRAGVRAGDLITAVDGESTIEMSIDEAVEAIRGPAGSTVLISILRGQRSRIELEIERAIVEVPTVKYAMIEPNIGFLRIIQFTPHTVERFNEALGFFEQNDYTSMIIDVRSNPGGLLSAVIDVADLFFERGTIVGTAGRDPSENTRVTARPGAEVPSDLPVVVLIDEGSASASEILAGTLQDRRRATLVGETTFGKGSVQQVHMVGDGGFRLTMSRYYLPSGRFIDKVGVDPDVEASDPELTEEQTETYFELLEQDVISEWVSENQRPSDASIDRFVEGLQSDGIDLPEFWLRRMIRDEELYQNNETIIYDLDFDTVLQHAVDMITEGALAPQ